MGAKEVMLEASIAYQGIRQPALVLAVKDILGLEIPELMIDK